MSRRQSASHPWHPVLVHFPIACWVLATLLDFLTRLPWPFEKALGVGILAVANLLLWIGLISALPTMVAGFVDYAKLSDEVLATPAVNRHVLWMGSATTLFLLAGIWRIRLGPSDLVVSWPLLITEAIAVICLILGGRQASALVFQYMRKLPRLK